MKKVISLITAVLLMCTLIFAFAAPGTSDDPLVSLSYINDTLIPEIHKYIDEKLQSFKGDSNTAAASSFEVVDVKKDQTVKAGKGCEMILRMGSGSIVGSANGGISDVTAGYDLADGTPMPSNHLLICPLDDGRGIKVTADGKIMIKGSYTLE